MRESWKEAISWNYTTWLNIGFLLLAALLVWRFLRTGGPEMLRMMSSDHSEKGHNHSADHGHAHHHG
jgi:ABC-type nickel/cobalt efflux system permease component RcnA